MPNCEDFIKHTDTQFEQAENELKGKSDDEKKDIIQSAKKELTLKVTDKFNTLLSQHDNKMTPEFCADIIKAKYENVDLAVGLGVALCEEVKKQNPSSVSATPHKSRLLESTAASRAASQPKQQGGDLEDWIPRSRMAKRLTKAAGGWTACIVLASFALPQLAAVAGITAAIYTVMSMETGSSKIVDGGGSEDEDDVCNEIKQMIDLLPEEIKQTIDKQVAEAKKNKYSDATEKDTAAFFREFNATRAAKAAGGRKRKSKKTRKSKKSRKTRRKSTRRR